LFCSLLTKSRSPNRVEPKMGFLDLPTVDKIKTPYFLFSFDETLEACCSPGGFSTSGVNWRMWLIYGIQIFFLFLCLVIGANIQIGVSYLPSGSFDAADAIRLVGGLPGVLAAILGAIGLYLRRKWLLVGNVVFNAIGILFLMIAWILDATDASALASANGTVVGVGAQAVTRNFTSPLNKAASAAVFGALGWVMTIIAFYLTYAHYQEMDSSAAAIKKPKPAPQEAQITMTPPQAKYQPSVSPPVISQPTRNAPVQAKSQSKGKMHNCPQCSTEWPFDVKFCGECGSKIPDAPEAQAPSAKPSEVWEEHFTDDGYMYYYNPKTGESKWAES